MKNKITIDENYSIIHDGYKGCTLVFEEIRERKKVDPKTRKETGEIESYLFKDFFYYPNPKMCLEKYASIKTDHNLNLNEYFSILKSLELKAEDLSKQYSEIRGEFFKTN